MSWASPRIFCFAQNLVYRRGGGKKLCATPLELHPDLYDRSQSGFKNLFSQRDKQLNCVKGQPDLKKECKVKKISVGDEVEETLVRLMNMDPPP
jgi:hypothetical protein